MQSMANGKSQKRLLDEVAPQYANGESVVVEQAYSAYELYKQTAEVIERYKFASGKKRIYTPSTVSTLDDSITRYGGTAKTI